MPLCFSQTLEIDLKQGTQLDEALKTAVVSLVKGDVQLAQNYSFQMDKAFDFLDPEDPRRQAAADIDNLGDWSLNLWTPTHSFRYGQGDQSVCADETEIASTDFGTLLVGFDTSYKREETYGFWASINYFYIWCEKSDGTVGNSKVEVTFKKWISQETVSQILGF